ncbi:MAG: LPS translocon maturation chaperone LptM [Gammaproteobacteria bacterium]
MLFIRQETPMHPRRSFRIGWLLICLSLLLAACGQKGDLYHPDEKQSAAGTSLTSV